MQLVLSEKQNIQNMTVMSCVKEAWKYSDYRYSKVYIFVVWFFFHQEKILNAKFDLSWKVSCVVLHICDYIYLWKMYIDSDIV